MTTWLVILSVLIGFSLAISLVAARIALLCVISAREALTKVNSLLAQIEDRVHVNPQHTPERLRQMADEIQKLNQMKPTSIKPLSDNVTQFPHSR